MTAAFPHITRGIFAVVLAILLGAGGMTSSPVASMADDVPVVQEALIASGLPVAQAAENQRDWSRTGPSSDVFDAVVASSKSTTSEAALPAASEEAPQVRLLFLDFLQLRL